jgi:hypothetical protein
MNTNIQNLAMLSAVIAFGCHSNRTGMKTDRKSEPQTVLAETKTSAKPETRVIEGTVKNVFHEKDGFVASIQTKDNMIYLATVSRANLKDPHQYRDFKISEQVRLNGDYWKMNDEDQLTVREIQ